jgi:hypothetical protein
VIRDPDALVPSLQAASAAAPAAPTMREDLRVALVLAAAAGVATLLVFPYLLDLMPDLRAKSPMPLPALAALQALQGLVLCGVLAWLGLRMQPRAGLDAPWLRALLARRPRPPVAWAASAGLGVLAAIAVGACAWLLDPHLPARLHPAHAAPAASAWHGLLASFYGGIVEEIELRLFLMTLLAWLAARLVGRAPTPAAYWSATVVAALLFGAGHLPAAAQVWPMDAFVVLRTIALNAIAGVAFGWLYWKRGLEAAIAGHFAADLVLHVAAPLLPGVLA